MLYTGGGSVNKLQTTCAYVASTSYLHTCTVADPEGGTWGTCPPSHFLIHYLKATTLTAN